jgi:hypothetical protein
MSTQITDEDRSLAVAVAADHRAFLTSAVRNLEAGGPGALAEAANLLAYAVEWPGDPKWTPVRVAAFRQHLLDTGRLLPGGIVR